MENENIFYKLKTEFPEKGYCNINFPIQGIKAVKEKYV